MNSTRYPRAHCTGYCARSAGFQRQPGHAGGDESCSPRSRSSCCKASDFIFPIHYLDSFFFPNCTYIIS